MHLSRLLLASQQTLSRLVVKVVLEEFPPDDVEKDIKPALAKVPKSSIGQAIRKLPHLLGCSVDKLMLMVNHFAELGISNRNLGQVIAKSPRILRKSQNFQQMVYFLKRLGLDEETVGRIVGQCPEIFATDMGRILKKKVEFLNRIGVSQGNSPPVIRKYPELFVCDVNKTLLPR